MLRSAIPAGSIMAAATFAAYALARASGLALVQQRTAATLVTLILSLCVLVPTAPALALASKVSSATCQVAGTQLPDPAIQPVIAGAPAGSHDTATMACGIRRPGVTV